MLETIKDFFVTFMGIVTALVDFVIGFVEDIVYVVQLTADFVAKIPYYFVWLPDVCVSLIVAIFAVVVIYKVLGREG